MQNLVSESDDYQKIDFNKLDSDNDGFITKYDLKDWNHELAQEWLSSRDNDSDAKVSFQEFTVIRKKILNQLWIDNKLDQIRKYEEDKCVLPDWYKSWILANSDNQFSKGLNLEEHPPEYVFMAMKVRQNLLSILDDKI